MSSAVRNIFEVDLMGDSATEINKKFLKTISKNQMKEIIKHLYKVGTSGFEEFQGATTLKRSNLSVNLRELEDLGLVERWEEREGRQIPRAYFKLTDQGKKTFMVFGMIEEILERYKEYSKYEKAFLDVAKEVGTLSVNIPVLESSQKLNPVEIGPYSPEKWYIHNETRKFFCVDYSYDEFLTSDSFINGKIYPCMIFDAQVFKLFLVLSLNTHDYFVPVSKIDVNELLEVFEEIPDASYGDLGLEVNYKNIEKLEELYKKWRINSTADIIKILNENL